MFLKLLYTYELPRDLVQNKNSDSLGLPLWVYFT